MYVDSKPVSTYAETQGWKLPMPSPSPQPPGSLKRPPLLSHGSSSSSLSGMEQAIPFFRSFVNRTPPADQQKPLPPTPLIPRRASSTSPPRSRTPSSYGRRRSSSIYSRTVSQWLDDHSSWRSADLRDDPMPEMPPLPILQPVAYSKSTPQLIDRPAAPPPQFLEPRTYSPLIITPSPTASRVTTPNRSPGPSPTRSPLRQRHTPVMYPTSPPIQDGPKKQVHTVSLEQAKAAVHSPGAVHLLPEELRAQTLGKSRSHDLIRVPMLMFFEKTTPPELPEPPTLVDIQGRHRSLQGHGKFPDVGSEYPFPVMHAPPLPSPRIVRHEDINERSRAPLETQPRRASKDKAVASLGLDNDEEPRGRTRQRGPRSMEYAHYMPNVRRVQSSPSPNEERTDAQKVASEYHNLLSEQYRQPSSSPACNSDDSIKAHMKMVPQPLFKTKPAAKLPGSVSGISIERESNASVSPFHSRADSQATGSSQGSLPLRLSLTPDSVHRRTSTSGSIPISPPTNLSLASPAPVRRTADSPVQSKKPSPRRKSKDDRVSMYYPYIGPRKGKKAKERKASAAKEGEQPVPAMPLLSADIIAQRLKTPEGSAESSPLRSTASFNLRSNMSSHRKDSNASSDRQCAPFFQRLAGNAVKYADRITSPSATSAGQTHRSTDSSSTTASPHSPHLLPSPVKCNPPPVHLGWSDSAKTTFDRSRSSWQSAKSPQTPQSAHFTHLPARPLDESRFGLRESADSPSPGRKASIFGGLLDGWKERKKEERREELKKIIRVVPTGPPPRMRTMDIVPSSNPNPGQGLVRQGSMDTAAPKSEGPRPVSGGLARRMSAFGWM